MERVSDFICLLNGEPAHWCPACDELHRYFVNQPNPRNGAHWKWDGNGELPTFTPSMNLSCGGTEEWLLERCHYTLTAGKLQFHGDSTHVMAGMTVPLPRIPPLWSAYAIVPRQ